MNNFIIPSIDLLDSQVVRLYKGDYNNRINYEITIDSLLEKYKDFANLHIVDLNGAKGELNQNKKIIEHILQNFKGNVQIGGGIRSIEDAKKAFKIGANRVVLGTIAIKNYVQTLEIFNKFGKEKVVIAIDVAKINGRYIPQINGWQENSQTDLFEILKKYSKIAQYILCTDISVDGTMNGPNLALYKVIKAKFPNFILQSSGGVSSMQDIKKLQKIADNAIVGKAFYENLIDFVC